MQRWLASLLTQHVGEMCCRWEHVGFRDACMVDLVSALASLANI
jgi:hypothetical protein